MRVQQLDYFTAEEIERAFSEDFDLKYELELLEELARKKYSEK